MLSHTRHLPLLLLLACLAPAAAHADLRSVMRDWQDSFQPTATERAAGAVVLEKTASYTVREDGANQYRMRVVIAVLDEQAAQDYTRFQVGFNAYFEDMKLVAAHILDRDGTLRDASADAIQVKTADAGSRFDDSRNLTFAMPAVRPGSILAYELLTTGLRPVIPGQWFDHIPFVRLQPLDNGFRLDPTRQARLTLDTPAGAAVSFKALNTDVLPQVSQRDGRTLRVWTLHDIPGVRQENNMPPLHRFIPSVALSSLHDWSSIDSWATAAYRERLQPDAALRRVVADLVRPDMTPLQKTKAIFYYVQKNIRYIGADLDRGGFIPHHVSEILNNRYGDCKDQAAILIAMLRSAGIEAYPSLIGSLHQPPPVAEVPSPYFSHMIVYAPGIAGGQWMDTSGDAGSFPAIAWQLEGRQTFILDGRGGHMLTLPRSSATDNGVDVNMAYSYQGDDILADIRVRLRGVMGNTFKLLHKHDPNHKQPVRKIATGFHNNSELRSLDITANLNNDRPYTFHAVTVIRDGFAADKRDQVRFGGDLSGLIAFFSSLAQVQNQSTRHSDFYIGFPYSLHQRSTFPPPGDAYRPILPSGPQTVDNRWFDYHRTIRSSAQNIQADNTFVVKQPTVTLADYPRFRSTLLETLRQSSWLAVYRHDEQYRMQRRLEHRLVDDTQDPGTLLKLANHHLLMAEYPKAEALASQVIRQHPDNGEAYYVLGISLGFMDRFQASEDALKKARQLGYTR